ncbi:biotin--[acetyl-CoA-carboxylase] ligase [Desulfovibrio sp. DV]|uniref:biotin--[acetyl-CoA-carboxylase] ligase n=1 Tax=Desulfovibrio sp. DV TaxID=1844708 RepID=UPI00094BB4E2|nr:biotin--[acetyl-CoA-carboxylase] ligase [Desulfovibrio sp. DV]
MQNPFAGGGIWLRTSGDEALAGQISPEILASCHPIWAADAARLAPWREVVLGPQYGPAAGRWLEALGPGGAAADAVLLVGPCASSLDVAWELAAAGCLPPFASVVAVSQTRGRGQMRRDWVSPPGNLYAALAWPVASGNLAAMAPVVVGACLSDALYDRGFPTQVKWPNDLLVCDRKIGGILLEERGGRILAGIGINFASAPDAALLRRDHAAPAASLQVFGEVPGAVTLWSDLVKSGQTCYLQCVALSDSNALSRFVEQRLAWLGREVFVRESGTDGFRARIIGLAEDGGLRLRRIDSGPGQDLTLHSGSISLL